MEFNFQQILDQLNAGLPQSNFSWAIARGMTTPEDYLFNTLLPNVDRPTFEVKGGNMTFTPTMLQGVPMDDKLPPFGAISSSTFFENTTKIGGATFFTEKDLRDMYEWEMSIMRQAMIMGGDVYGSIEVNDQTGLADGNTINGARVNRLLGMSRMMMQAHWDTQEYLKGKALSYGLIGGTDFAFLGTKLDVNYDIPAGNKFTSRSGNDAYGGSTSKFWTDIRNVYKKLSNPRFFMNSNTYYSIIDQTVNNVVVTDGSLLSRFHSMKRIVKYDATRVAPQTPDQRDKITLEVYDRSGSVLKSTNGVAELQAVPFLPDGKIIVVGDLYFQGLELTAGAVQNPDLDLSFGYNHVAPTVEGQMAMGIWSRIYTPEQKPMQLQAETVVNQLPVILNPKRLVILTTTL